MLTNKKKTEEGEVEISAPAFSITKIVAAMGLLIGGILAAMPAAVKDKETVAIAVIAAATVVLLGVFALVAVDIRTRQRAQEAKRRWPLESDASNATSAAAGVALGTLAIQVDGAGDSGSEQGPSPQARTEPRIIELERGEDVSVVISDRKR